MTSEPNETLIAKPWKVADLVKYQDGSVVSRVSLKQKAGIVSLFAFDAGQELSEHTALFDGDGECVRRRGRGHDLGRADAGDDSWLAVNYGVLSDSRMALSATAVVRHAHRSGAKFVDEINSPQRPRWDSNPRITDLQSVPLVHLGTRPRFWNNIGGRHF